MSRMPSPDAALTVVILTLNEARNLPGCLAAVPDIYPVLVVDCGSTDGTAAIAAEAGCPVVTHPWEGFAAQRNYALEQCGLTTPWVLFIDADEVFTGAFYDWFEKEGRSGDFDVGQVTQTLIFKGKALRHAPGYPLYHPRLVRRDRVRFVLNHTGHGEAPEAGARERIINIPYLHDWYQGDLAAWLTKHIRLAAQEADLRRAGDGVHTARARLSLLVRSAVIRVPARFLYHYVWRGGFRDGRYGLEYAMMYTWFEVTKGLFRLAKEGK